MAPIKLYKIDASPVVRAVFATGAALGITFEEHNVDILKGEQLKEEFVKLNPLHTVPTLDDNGFIICDSHVINSYLVEKYGKHDTLYPKDLHQRVLIDQKLAFDLGLLYPTLREIDDALLLKEVSALTFKMEEKVRNLYNFLETMLEGKRWVSLDDATIADFSCYTTITSLNYHVPIDGNKYPNVIKWINRCKILPCFSNDHKYLQSFRNILDSTKI